MDENEFVRSIVVTGDAATLPNILLDWPDASKPSATTLLLWLHKAYDQMLIRRQGRGHKSDPFRYRLPNEDEEYWDGGELPPLRELVR